MFSQLLIITNNYLFMYVILKEKNLYTVPIFNFESLEASH